MERNDVYKEIEKTWKVNDNTTLGEIKQFYEEITGNTNLSIGKKIDYLYDYILESMLKDEDISLELYEEIRKELEI